MTEKVYIGIDNGVSGTIGIIEKNEYFFYQMPTRSQQDYVKTKKLITRIDSDKLFSILAKYQDKNIIIKIERPMINSLRFTASLSAIRALEATLNVIELFDFSYDFLDSKSWQSELLPIGTKTTPELKMASLDLGIRLFPKVSETILKHKDADGILIAEWAKRFDQGTIKKKYKTP